jgi:three-Cys-motif partner protein
MSRSKGHFEKFQPHSKHKHIILDQYFSAWGHKLGLRENAGSKILYVDACAGRGTDELGNHGSPLIAAKAAVIAQASISRRREAPFQIDVVAIEFDRAHHAALANVLAPFGDTVRALRGKLEDHISLLEREYPDTPTLYLIDPFGLDPLQAALVRRAIAGDKHEALLLFADQAALRHFGAIVAEETRAERRHREAADPLPLFPELPAEGLATLAVTAHESREALDNARETAIRILNSAFGDDAWLPQIEAIPQHARRAAFIRFYSERLLQWGATHVLQIPIVDKSGTRAYTLIHASKSAKAFTAMKEAVTYALNNSPLPENVVERMKAMVRSNVEDVVRAVLHRFASRTVRWTEDSNDRRLPCVRRFALEETNAFPFEFEELKERLRQFRMPGKSIVYKFPGEQTNVDQD